MTRTKDPLEQIRPLLAAVAAVGSDLDLSQVLHRIVEAATRLVDATYGALGVLAEDGQGLARFITVGIDDATIARIGPPPRGHGVLGQLITEPHPLRLKDLGSHPTSYGFPENHPAMHSFLGVPVRIGQEVFGNLYLTEKRGGREFSDEDEALVVALAVAAGVAIQNARLYAESRRRGAWMEAGREISTLLLSGTAQHDVLALVAARAKSVLDADLAFVILDDADGQHIETAAGPDAHAEIEQLREQLRDVLATDAPRGVATKQRTGTAVPVGSYGVLVCLWEEPPSHPAAEDLADFGNRAAVALELAEHRRQAEHFAIVEDRDRIARDLHDLVIQRLFATGMQLQSAIRMIDDSPEQARDRVNRAVDELDGTIRELRSTIYGLQTPLEGQPSLRARILEVVDNAAEQLGFTPSLRLDGLVDTVATPTVSEHLLATLREALSNVARHAQARNVDVFVGVRGSVFTIRVEDDGLGMSEDAARSGLVNIARRAEELGGHLRVTSAIGRGTTVSWQVPA